MRIAALAGAAALSAWALPAMALVEPDAAGVAAEPKRDERDARMRSVEYSPGAVIRLVASRGQSLMVELPRGQEISTFLVSDQDVMDNTPPPEDERPGQNRNQNQGVGGREGEDRPRPCSLSANLQVCVRNDRFLAVKPITELDPQPLHVVAVRAKPNGQIEEVPYLFELVTAERDAEDRERRVAGPAQASPSGHYYYVRVVMPPSTGGALAIGPARRVPRRPPPVAAPAPQALPPPPPANNQYEVQGDRSLVGAAR